MLHFVQSNCLEALATELAGFEHEVLYISFCGMDLRDQTGRLPSVLVSELLDYAERAFSAPPGKSVRELLVIKHPLQAFSPRYFDGASRLFSYSRSLCEAIAQQSDTTVRDFFIHQRLPEPGSDRRSVSLDQLLRFLGHAIRFLLQERLGAHLRSVIPVLGSAQFSSRNSVAIRLPDTRTSKPWTTLARPR